MKSCSILNDWRGNVWEECNLKEVTEVKFASRYVVKCSDCSGSICFGEHPVVRGLLNSLCLMLHCNLSGKKKSYFLPVIMSTVWLQTSTTGKKSWSLHSSSAVVCGQNLHVNKSLLSLFLYFFKTFSKYELYHSFLMKFYTFQYYKCTLCIVKSLAHKPFAWPTSVHLKFRDVWELCSQNGSVTALFCSRLSCNRLPNRLNEQFELLITSHVTNFNLDKRDQVRIKWTILKVQQQDFVKFKCVTEVKHPRSL